MDPAAKERFGTAQVARLATITPGGAPHLVPVVFALVDDSVWLVVDTKPKSGRPLQRLANIGAHPRVSLLVDHYDDDWSAVWWVRADGVAAIVPIDDPQGEGALAALAAKYPQYAVEPPPGPLIRIEVGTWRSWAASGS